MDETKAATLKQKTGIDLTGYVHHMDDAAVRHIFKGHSNPDVEAARNQKPITEADLLRIPEITNPATADSVEKGKKTNDL